jgi:hypothetical protein
MKVAENHHSGRSWPLRTVQAVAGPALLLLVSYLFFWKITLTSEYTWFDSPDLVYQVLPWYQLEAGEWAQGRIPLWDPYTWNGQPLIGQGQPGVAYPLNWLLFHAPMQNGWIRQLYLNWYFVFIHFMAAWFAYLLCRDLRRSKIASMVAGCSFGFGGLMGSNDWPQMINGAVWAPLVLMFLLRVGRKDSPLANSAFAGAALGMAWLSGHHQIPIFISLTATGYWAYLILRRRRIDWRMAAPALTFALMLFCVSALQTLPAYEYGSHAKRWVSVEDPIGWNDKVPYLVHQMFSSGPLAVLGILFPSLARNSESYVGIVAFSLALAGFFAWRRKIVVRTLATIAVGAFLFSLGNLVVEHGMLYALVPMLEKARTPSMALLVFQAALAPLLAFGVDSLEVSRMKPLRWALVGGAGVLYLFILGFTMARKYNLDDRLVLAPFLALLLAGLLFLRSRGEVAPHIAKLGIFALLLLELGNFTTFNYSGKYDKGRTVRYFESLTKNADIVAYLRTCDRPFRINYDDQEIPYNFGDWHGIETAGGYVASLTENIASIGMHDEAIQDLFAVDYEVRKKPSRPGQIELFTGSSGLKIFKNPSAMPRAWVIHQVKPVEKRSIIPRDPRREATIRGAAPQLADCPDDARIEWMTRNASHIALRAQTACRGLVVVADTYYPGWRATVDGAPAKILEVNAAQRGIVIEAGIHRVEMRYRPTSVIAGAILTAFGCLMTLGIFVWKVRST